MDWQPGDARRYCATCRKSHHWRGGEILPPDTCPKRAAWKKSMKAQAADKHRQKTGGKAASIKKQIHSRDPYCFQCGQSVDLKGCHLDHEIPVSKGGPTDFTNCRLLCLTCHKAKTTREATAARRASHKARSL